MSQGVILIGNFRPAAAIARAAARLGRKVAAGVFGDTAYVDWSNAVSETFEHEPLDTHPHAAEAALQRFFAERPEYGIVLPVSEIAARFAAERRERFGARATVASPQTEIVRLVAEKDEMCARCDAIGVPVAPYAIVRTVDEARDTARRIGFPVVVKPANSARYLHDRKAAFAANDDEFDAALPAWPAGHDRLIVQRRVVGPRLIVLFGAHEGRLLGAITLRATRTTEREDLGQTCGAIVIEPSVAVRRGVEALIADVNYSGIGSIEWMVDQATGALSFLEVNPRFDGTSSMAEACGLPLTRWAIEIAEGGAPAPLAEPYGLGRGRRMTWTKGDVTRLSADARAGRLDATFAGHAVDALLDVLRGEHVTFSLKDPGPALGNHLNPILKLRPWSHRPGRRLKLSVSK